MALLYFFEMLYTLMNYLELFFPNFSNLFWLPLQIIPIYDIQLKNDLS